MIDEALQKIFDEVRKKPQRPSGRYCIDAPPPGGVQCIVVDYLPVVHAIEWELVRLGLIDGGGNETKTDQG